MLYNYVDTDLDDNLICCICRNPFNEPVTTRTCFHTFCQECILQALGVSNHCPIDRSPLSVGLLGQADPIVRHLVEELIVRCPNLDVGCVYTGERHLIESHLKLQCPYVQVSCPCSDEDCKRTMARRDVLGGETVIHELTDAQPDNTRIITCESCEKVFSHVSEVGDHLASSCSEKIVPCSQTGNGCTWKGRRLSLEAHTEKCPYESIKGFFAIHDSKMAQLSKENERLRRRTDELEGAVRILRQELEWAKVALEPWYRPIYSERPSMTANYNRYPSNGGPNTMPGPNQVGQVLLQRMNLATSNTSLPGSRGESGATETLDLFDPFTFIGQSQGQTSNVHAANNPSTTTTIVSSESNPSLSAYTNNHAVGPRDSDDIGGDAIPESGSSNSPGFIQDPTGFTLSPGTSNLQSASTAPSLPNPMSTNPIPSIHSHNQQSISASTHSHPASPHSVPCNPPQFMPSVNKHVVAPLNLSTTVEGSLVGLRESLVTLSEALESQGRRQELALTTEGLRVSEEVGSLKAVVQGLRMQVHAIMMDRNALVTGRFGGILNVPSNLGSRSEQPHERGGMANEEPSEDPEFHMSEESGPYSPGGSRYMEGYHGYSGLWGFPSQQPIPPGVTIPMMGPNFLIGPPPHPSVRFNHIGQSGVSGGRVLPLGGVPMGQLSPHHLYMSPTGGSGPKL